MLCDNLRMRNFILFTFLFAVVCAEEPRPKVCLNMIVKNESEVIERCLNSVLPIIDYWVIVDTGSSDGTQQIIKDFMHKREVPGELFERPWVNFGHNRNEALSFAQGKADYLFFIDADEYLKYDAEFKLPTLDKDYYYMVFEHSGTKYSRIKLINTRLNWKWEGVLHEVLSPPPLSTYATVEHVVNVFTPEGFRSKDPEKYKKDAEILEAELIKDPHNARNVFYLAQSYRDARDYPQALKTYEKRASMGGWDQEVFYSLLQVGLIQERLEMPSEKVINSYLQAYIYRRARAEPLYQIARLYRTQQNYKFGYHFAKMARSLPPTQDILLVQQWVNDYGIALELSICAYWIGQYEECRQLCHELLKKQDLPENVRTCVEKNLEFANAKVKELQTADVKLTRD